MKTIYSFLLLLLSSSLLWGQKIDNKYLQSVTSNGNLYFIKAQKIKNINQQAPKEMEYDLTYLDSRDSASYTCTVHFPHRLKQINVYLTNDKDNYPFFPELLYAQKKKSYWQYRLRWNMAFSDLTKIYQSPTAYTLSFQDEHQNTYTYSLSEGKWKKQQSIILSIFDVIEVNRKSVR